MASHGGEVIAPKVSATGLGEWCQDHDRTAAPVDSITKSDRTKTELNVRVYLLHVMVAVLWDIDLNRSEAGVLAI
jgi:hypothetical protein